MGDSLKDQLEQAMAEFEQQRQALIRVKEEVAAIEVKVSSRDRAVELTLGADGSPKALRFVDSRHKSMSGQELAASVLEAFQVAREELNVRVQAGFGKATGLIGARERQPGDRLKGLGLERLLEPLQAPGGPLHAPKE